MTRLCLRFFILLLLFSSCNCHKPDYKPDYVRDHLKYSIGSIEAKGATLPSIPRGGQNLPSGAYTAFGSPSNPTQTKAVKGAVKGGNGTPKIFNEAALKSSIDSFLSYDSRKTFITRVYTILSLQLLTTGLFITLSQIYRPQMIKLMLSSAGPLIQFLSAIISVASFFGLMLKPELRKGPHKFKLLTVFTISESILLALLTSMFPSHIVSKAVVTTGGATLAVTGYVRYNKNPKYDLTQYGSGIFGFGLAFLAYQLLHISSYFLPIPRVPWNEMLGCSFGAGLATAYLAYHTSLIISGNSKYRVESDDYVFGAMALYNDIINLFVYILRLYAESERRNKD
ncbi:hypothetical protein TrST_g5695 [Triparma strigata]|uniref:Uncharacterized protein n=1 Tax=Triparma strigata TaxID=1606541 RepID=A0A9W6ZQJ9_9STRA|nr:hypothetical protein TrST_g5695 [Triparma strigata]